MPVQYEPSSWRWARVHVSRSVAVALSPAAAWAMAHSAVSAAVTHGSSLTQRTPRPGITNVSHAEASRCSAWAPTSTSHRTG